MTAELFTACAALTGAAAILADRGGRRRRSFYLLKPLTTLLIIAVALVGPSDAPEPYRRLVISALVFALLGDILLMAPSARAFAGGLAAFLVAHLLFIPALLMDVQLAMPPAWFMPVLAGAVVLAVVLARKAGPLAPAVLLYVAALGGMAYAAAVRAAAVPEPSAQLALAGALLFVVSDSALGTRRFLRPYPGAQAFILSTYWSGIGLLAWSA